jgi:hypothetical protein
MSLKWLLIMFALYIIGTVQAVSATRTLVQRVTYGIVGGSFLPSPTLIRYIRTHILEDNLLGEKIIKEILVRGP